MSPTYQAFISYSHAADGRLAPSLQTALQQFGKPWYRLRALRIFRDQTNLSVNPALWTSIVQALDQSDYFIFLASPDAARSKWVEQEVSYWRAKKHATSILLVLTDGDLAWDPQTGTFDRARTNALPEGLWSCFTEEPRFLDLRWAKQKDHLSLADPRFRDAVADLAATLQGRPKDELIGEEVREHRKTKRLAWSAVIALVVLTTASVFAAWMAIQQRAVAESQTQVAVAQQKAAERQSRISLAGKLAAEADVLRRTQAEGLPLSVLLAIESLRLHESAEAERSLRAGLRLLPLPIAAFHHGEQVTAIAFSPDGRRLASGSDDGTAGIHEFRTGESLASLPHEETPGQVEDSPSGGFSWKAPGYGAEVRALSFSADGRRLATGNQDGTARVWDAEDNTELFALEHGDGVVTVAFHPEGRRLATGSKDGTARLWDLETGREQIRVEHNDEVREVAFTGDGRYLAAISTGGVVDLWDLKQDGAHVHWGTGGAGLGLAFSSDGTRLATASDNFVVVWSVDTQEAKIRVEHRDYVGDAKMIFWNWLNDVAFSPDGAYLGTAGRDGTARIWDASTGQEVVRLTHASDVTDVEFSPDAQTLLSASYDGTARLWELPSGRERLRLVHGGLVQAVAFSPDGSTLASSDSAGTVRLWGLDPGDQVTRMVHGNDVVAVAYSPDGETIASADEKGNVQFWTQQGEAKSPPMRPPQWKTEHLLFNNDGVRLVGRYSDQSYLLDPETDGEAVSLTSWRDTTDLAMSPRFLAARTKDGAVQILSTADGHEVIRLTHKEPFRAVRLSRTGDYLLTGHSDRSVRAWTLPQGQELISISAADVSPEKMAVSPQGHLVATATKSEIKVWGTPTESPPMVFSQKDPIRALWFSPGGDRLIILTYSDVYIRESATGATVARLQHQGEIRSRKLGLWHSISMSDTNDVIATLSDGRVYIWDLANGRELARIGDGEIIDMAFSPDGRWLLTGNADETAIVWKWRFDDLIAAACARLERNLTETEWSRFLGTLPWHATCMSTSRG